MGAFVAHLRELGWIVGDNIAAEYRWTEGSSRRVSEIAAEFVRDDIDVIVTYGSAVPILKQATTTIPIVFAVAFDPQIEPDEEITYDYGRDYLKSFLADEGCRCAACREKKALQRRRKQTRTKRRVIGSRA